MPSTRSTPRARRSASLRRDLAWLAGGLGGAGLLAALFVAPTDAVQGAAQRWMYLHVPAAWTAYLAFGVVLLCSVGYLVRGRISLDRRARAAAEIGVVSTTVTIAVGSLWGHLVWGVWWTWDPRLVSTALLLVVYLGYLAIRLTTDDPRRGARRAAVLGVAGFVLVPVVHFSVVWWRSLHQTATLLAPNPNPPIDPLMAATLMLCLAAFLAVAVRVYLWRVSSLEHAASDTPAARPPTLAGRAR